MRAVVTGKSGQAVGPGETVNTARRAVVTGKSGQADGPGETVNTARYRGSRYVKGRPQQKCSWEADGRTASQYIPFLLQKIINAFIRIQNHFKSK